MAAKACCRCCKVISAASISRWWPCMPCKLWRCLMQVQTRGVANILFLLSIVLLWFSNPSLCSSYAFTVPGIVNLQVSSAPPLCTLYALMRPLIGFHRAARVIQAPSNSAASQIELLPGSRQPMQDQKHCPEKCMHREWVFPNLGCLADTRRHVALSKLHCNTSAAKMG